MKAALEAAICSLGAALAVGSHRRNRCRRRRRRCCCCRHHRHHLLRGRLNRA